MVSKAYKLDIFHKRATLLSLILDDERFHLIEQHFLGYTTEELKCLLKTSSERMHVLTPKELHRQKP